MLNESVFAAASATTLDMRLTVPVEPARPIGDVLAIRHTLPDSVEPDPVFALILAEQTAWDAFNATMDVEEQAVTAFDNSAWNRQPRVTLGWYRSLYDANFDPVSDDQGGWKPDYISWPQAEQADRDRRDWIKGQNVSDERRAELFAKADKQKASWLASLEADAKAIDAARGKFGIDEAGAAMRAASGAAFEALNALCSATPTTTAGLLAMLDVCWARNVDSIDEEASSSISGAFAAVRSFVSADALRSPQTDPALAPISNCRSALTAYEEACKDSDQDSLDEPTEVSAAGLVFYEAWQAVRSTKPTTLAGVTAYAAFAINLSKHMGADDYVEQAMATLAGEEA